jgi:hypothetical protein
MFKSQQYRAKAAEYGELTKRSIGPDEIGKFQQLQDRLASLADNEQGLADDYDSARCGAGRIERRSPCNRRRARVSARPSSCNGTPCRRRCGERSFDTAGVGRQVIGDGGAPRANRPISAQAQG